MLSFLYLTTKGWKTGKEHRIEIWFVEHCGMFFLISEGGMNAHWVQNVTKDSGVSFRVGEKSYAGTARLVDATKEPKLASEVKALMESKYKWSDGLIVDLSPR